MTMLDEDQLRSLLTEGAETFEVPAAGPERVLSAAAAPAGGSQPFARFSPGRRAFGPLPQAW